MKRNSFLLIFSIFLLSTQGGVMAQSNPALVVKANQPIADIQPTMWGIFFEDINFAADGGLYAELVKNRSFEFSNPMMGWKELKQGETGGSLLTINQGEASAVNPRFVRVSRKSETGAYGLSNEGFRGMGIKKDGQYHFSVLARQQSASKLTLRVELVNAKGEVIGKASLTPGGDDWKKHSVTLTATATEPKASLNVWFEGQGSMDIDVVSLFPNDTWKGRPNGLRADLVQLLADMKPGFLRFPGGCIVEGRELATRYQWKKTVGMPEEREMIVNRWNTEFKHRPAPDYFQTFGLGFFEYFQLSEDLGAAPLPILSCGMACQFNTAEVVPMDQLDPYIQDALDLIEFANGATDTKWGKVRAGMGHPAPFNLRYIGVGNEQWGPQYIERYKVFAKAIKDKYPNILIISGTGPFPEGEYFDYAAKELKALNAEIIDEHYYNAPEWFLKNATRYDKYDRKGPKIFAGEYAAQSVAIASPDNKNNWQCALSEAAFMTGLERNAEVVHMTSYAPLFAHAEGWQWTPDLIWFDNLRSYGTPNYYVQKLFSNNRGTQVVPMLAGQAPVTGQNGLYATACVDKKTNELILKVVNASDKEQTQDVTIEGAVKLAKKGKATVLKSGQLNQVNTLDDPSTISPKDEEVTLKSNKLNFRAAPYSLSVIRIKM
jgi:alpha-L-arabinofuranosidase